MNGRELSQHRVLGASRRRTLVGAGAAQLAPVGRHLSIQERKRNMIRGSCCCGAIKFELSSPPSMMGTCHCSRCRKVGASTFVFVKKEDFRWIQGQDFVVRYEPEAPYKYNRTFCKKCGTALGEVGSQQDSFPIAANCLDTVVTRYWPRGRCIEYG
ncbi:MAG: GFA family protein, partial [Candidatus Contendobacter sp.]|nr:GFA family protein [Candidatus Contendobacter sp.]